MSIFTVEFWKSAAERALKTAGQVFIASIGVGLGFQDVNWGAIASVAGVAAVISIITSIISAQATGEISLTKSEIIEPVVGSNSGFNDPDNGY